MSKVRVHELAKEIDKTSKDIMEYLNGNGADLKSHMSFLTDQQVEAVKKKFGKPLQPEMLRRKRPSCRYSVRRTPREARDARGEEAVRDRLRQEQTADQAQIATEGKDLYPLRSEGATITVRQKTGMAIAGKRFP